MAHGSTTRSGVLVTLLILVTVGVGVYAVWRHPLMPDRQSSPPPRGNYDLGSAWKTDPALILYRQTAEVPLSFKEARAIAVGLDDRIVVAGDRSLVVFDPAGAQVQAIPLDDQPQAVALGHKEHAHPGRIYIALKNHVEVRDPAGKKLAAWTDLGPKALLTSIALGDEDVLTADAGRRLVHRFDTTGKVLGQIDGRDSEKDQEGFIVPSPYFHLAVSSVNGLVQVANPGKLRIEGYTLDGHREQMRARPESPSRRSAAAATRATLPFSPTAVL